MPSEPHEVQGILRELVIGTPGMTMSMLIDREGLPVCKYSKISQNGNNTDMAAVSSLSLFEEAKETLERMNLSGCEEMIVRALSGYFYALAIDGRRDFMLIARGDAKIPIGKLIMNARDAGERISENFRSG